MMLRKAVPLANLFAVHDDDPAALAAAERRLRGSGRFAQVSRPAPGWVSASSPLPDSVADPAWLRHRGWLFAEGRDEVLPDASAESVLSELVDASPDRLHQLPGDFGFIRFRAGGRATVVASCAGQVPFYWRRDGTSLAIGTRLGDFARHLPGPFRLDPLANSVGASGGDCGPLDRSYLVGVHRVPRGSFAIIEPSRAPTLRTYWDPRPDRIARMTPARVRDHRERLREQLLARLRRDLDPRGGNLITWSGGVDSSALAALAAGNLELPLWAWSFLPGPQDLFERDMGFIRPLAEAFGIRRHWITRVDARTFMELMPAAPPVVYHVPHPALCVLPSIHREAGVRVLVGGEFADNLLGGHEVAADWARGTSLLTLARSILGRPKPWRPARLWGRMRWEALRGRPAMPQPRKLWSFSRPELQDEYEQWYREQESAAAGDHGPMPLLAQWIREDGWVAMNWEATSFLGVRRSLPFYNREMIELAFELHPLEWGFPGDKKIERAALRGDVPAHNLDRADKGRWGGRRPVELWSWETPLPEALGDVVRRTGSPTRPTSCRCMRPRPSCSSCSSRGPWPRKLISLRATWRPPAEASAKRRFAPPAGGLRPAWPPSSAARSTASPAAASRDPARRRGRPSGRSVSRRAPPAGRVAARSRAGRSCR